MEDHLDEKTLTRLSGRKYAQSEASEKISEAPSVPREELEDVDGPEKEVKRHPENNGDIWCQRRDFKKMRNVCTDMTRLNRCGLLGVRCPSEKD